MWYTEWWQAGGREAQANMEETDGDRRQTAVSGSSRQLTLKKGAPGHQVWDLLCLQLASYLERGPLTWMMPLHLHVNQKSEYDRMICTDFFGYGYCRWFASKITTSQRGSWKCFMLMSSASIVLHANSVDPDQTAPYGVGPICLLAKDASKIQ